MVFPNNRTRIFPFSSEKATFYTKPASLDLVHSEIPQFCLQNDPDRGSDEALSVFYSRYFQELLFYVVCKILPNRQGEVKSSCLVLWEYCLLYKEVLRWHQFITSSSAFAFLSSSDLILTSMPGFATLSLESSSDPTKTGFCKETQIPRAHFRGRNSHPHSTSQGSL